MTTEAVCEQCLSGFDISEIERKLLQKLELSIGEGSYALPLPRKCPQCREQLRLPFRNEWNLFRRKCDWTEKELISVYPKVCELAVVDPAVWWSDEYDPLRYGREFDFSRTFFEQFVELNVAVPKAALQNVKSENSEFTNYAAENKNCYLCVGAAGNEGCYYSYRIMRSKNVCDSYDLVS